MSVVGVAAVGADNIPLIGVTVPADPEVVTPIYRRRWRPSASLTVLTVIAIIAALHFAHGFFVPLLVGILVSYGLRPVVDALQKLWIPRAIAAALVIGLVICGAAWVTYSLAGEATALIEKLPEAARKVRLAMRADPDSAPSALQNVQEAAAELQGAAADAGAKPGVKAPAPVVAPDSSAWLRDYALSQSALLAAVAAQTPIVLLLAYFLLASGDHFRRKLVQLVGPSLSAKKDALRILEEIDSQVQRYLFVMLVSNMLIAVGVWLSFGALGVEQAGIWGVSAGILHFVPYAGTVVFVGAATIAAFLQFGTVVEALAVAGVAVLVAGLIGMVFMTWLQSRIASVNAAALFIALLFFGWLWGLAGLLLGAPLLAIAKVISDRVDALEPMGELLSA